MNIKATKITRLKTQSSPDSRRKAQASDRIKKISNRHFHLYWRVALVLGQHKVLQSISVNSSVAAVAAITPLNSEFRKRKGRARNLLFDGADMVLVNKHSNTIEFSIARAPSQVTLEVKPERLASNLGEESVLEVTVLNEGDGPAENIAFTAELSDGLEISLGNEEKLINFLGSGENVRFQLFVRAVGQGDELVTVKVVDGRSGSEVVKTSMIRVG